MATHSSVLARRIPVTGEPGGLPSMGSHRVEHDWSDLVVAVVVVVAVCDTAVSLVSILPIAVYVCQFYSSNTPHHPHHKSVPASLFLLCKYVHLYLWVPILLKLWKLMFSSVQSFSRVQLFVTPWIAACQASLSITNSRSSLRLTFIESVMPSSHLILCRPLLLLPPIPTSIRVFSDDQLFAWGGQSTGVSALALFLPKNNQDWFPSEWTGWISLQSKGLSRVFSNTTVQKHQFFSVLLSL